MSSKEGVGTTFTVSLPLEYVRDDEQEPASLDGCASSGSLLLLGSHTHFQRQLANWGYQVELGSVEGAIEDCVAQVMASEAVGLLFEGLKTKQLMVLMGALSEADPHWHEKRRVVVLHNRVEESRATLEGVTIRWLQHDRMGAIVRAELEVCLYDGQAESAEEAPQGDQIERSYEGQVLLVEDVPFNQIIAMDFLEDLGLEVECANNGLEAVEAFKQNRYGLILMDLHMPEMNGFDAVRHIRQYEQDHDVTPVTPIVAMTADALSETRQMVIDVGMNGYLSKPFDPEDLYTVLDQYFS